TRRPARGAAALVAASPGAPVPGDPRAGAAPGRRWRGAGPGGARDGVAARGARRAARALRPRGLRGPRLAPQPDAAPARARAAAGHAGPSADGALAPAGRARGVDLARAGPRRLRAEGLGLRAVPRRLPSWRPAVKGEAMHLGWCLGT